MESYRVKGFLKHIELADNAVLVIFASFSSGEIVAVAIPGAQGSVYGEEWAATRLQRRLFFLPRTVDHRKRAQ